MTSGRKLIFNYKGQDMTLKQLAEISEVSKATLWDRILRRGLSVEDAVDTPKKKFCRPEIMITYMGESKTVTEWSNELSIERHTIHSRLRSKWPIADVLTAPAGLPIKKRSGVKKPLDKRPPLPEGCYWDGRYRVVCPNGKVFDYSTRKKKYYPKVQECRCIDCNALNYWEPSKDVKPKRCKRCNAINGSNRHVEAWASLRDELGVTRWSANAENAKQRCAKYGCDYQPGIDAVSVAERHDYECQECGIMLQPHRGGFHPEGWTVGHIMPLSKGGPHTWDNVQAECLACNMWKGNRRAYVDWDEVTNSVTM